MCELYRTRTNQIPSIYFSHKEKFLRDGLIWSHSPYVCTKEEDEQIEEQLFASEPLVI